MQARPRFIRNRSKDFNKWSVAKFFITSWYFPQSVLSYKKYKNTPSAPHSHAHGNQGLVFNKAEEKLCNPKMKPHQQTGYVRLFPPGHFYNEN